LDSSREEEKNVVCALNQALNHHVRPLHQHKSMGSSTFGKVFSLISFFLFVSPHVASIEEADALLTWKASLQKESQSQLSSWTLLPNNATGLNSSTNPSCSWFGIYCNHAESVIGMNLTYLGLKGSLHEFSFLSFPNLEFVNLSMNSLFGTIPP
jgi:hypothetical protein